HGRAILGLKKKDQLPKLVDKIRKEHLNVRQVEQLINRLNEEKSKKKPSIKKKDPFIIERETHLREKLGTNVSIEKKKNKGKIEIEFYNQDDLTRLLDYLDK